MNKVVDDPYHWTQQRCRQWWRDTKEAKAVGERLTADELAVFMRLLARHPRADTKIGPGVDYVFISLDEFRQKGYTIMRVDGTAAVPGIHPIMTKRVRTSEEILNHCCRYAVHSTSHILKMMSTQTVCGECGEQLSNDPKQVHADHEQPWTFKAIFAAWCSEYRALDVFDPEVHAVKEDAHTYRFHPETAAGTSELFKTYHDERAKLRIICRRCNIRHGRNKA